MDHNTFVAVFGGGGGKGKASPSNISNLAMMLDINDIETKDIDGWNGVGSYCTGLNDQSGNGYDHDGHGVDSALPFVNTTEEALQFDASQNTFLARLGSAGCWNIPEADESEFTICMMVKAADFASKYLFCRYIAATDFHYIRPNAEGEAQFISEAGDSRLINIQANLDAIPTNEWVLITMRVKRTTSAAILYNTSEKTTLETANGSGSQTLAAGASSLFCRDSANSWTSGYLRALLIYDRMLTDAEIDLIYDYYK